MKKTVQIRTRESMKHSGSSLLSKNMHIKGYFVLVFTFKLISKLTYFQFLKREKVSQVILKLSKYIAFHHISLESFWKSTRIYASLDEFVDYCLDTGFDLKEPELDAIQEELTD